MSSSISKVSSSSASQTMQQAQPQSQPQSHLLTPTTNPIPLLTGNPLAKAYSTAHTAGILMYYYLRSSSLVADPLITLVQDLVPVAILQAVFCVVCVPRAGVWDGGTVVADLAAGTRGGDGGGGGGAAGRAAVKSFKVVQGQSAGSMRRKGAGVVTGGIGSGKNGGPLQGRIMAAIFSLILTLTVPPVPLTVLALVLGAPLYPTSLLPHTAVLALHVSVLALTPVFYAHGVSASAWRDVAAAWLPFDESGSWAGAVGCMVGGWIGAIPVALDWDREWQKWPCTVVWGAVLGWGIGRFITSTIGLGIGRRIDLSGGKRLTGFGDTLSTRQQIERKVK